MGSMKDFFKSFFGVKDRDENFEPHGLPRDIIEDFMNHSPSRPPQGFSYQWPYSLGDHGNHYNHHHGYHRGDWVPFNNHHHHNNDDQEHYDDGHLLHHDDFFQEMDQLFQNFFQGFPGIEFHPNIPGIEAPPHEMNPETDDDRPVRDKMLKKEDEPSHSHPHNLPSPPVHGFRSLFDNFFGGQGHPQQGDSWSFQRHEDKDLDEELRDGKMSLDDVLSQQHQDQHPPGDVHKGQVFSQGFSSKMSTIVHGNGATETRKTKKDSSGNEEVTVTRTLGNQSHSRIYKTDRDGNEEVHENMLNMDEDDLQEFEEKWSQASGSRPSGNLPMISHQPSNSLYDTVRDFFFPPR